MRFLLPILLLPLAEIAGFAYVGQELGVLNTLGLVLASMVLGILLVRHRGLETLRRAQQRIARGEPPVREAFDGVFLVLAGILLIIPGFVTDVLALLLLLPPVRNLVFRRAELAVQVQGLRGGAAGGREWRVDPASGEGGPEAGPEAGPGGRRAGPPQVIDGEYAEMPDRDPPRLS
ncbi:MAG: hypothetical protein RLY86_3579 [Pseudomonadota bacterium]|jgi:UPF0716 protein FxsA